MIREDLSIREKILPRAATTHKPTTFHTEACRLIKQHVLALDKDLFMEHLPPIQIYGPELVGPRSGVF